MRLDRDKAESLRKAGKSYLEISRELGIPKATLSKWFSKEVWSQGVQKVRVQAGKAALRTRVRDLVGVRRERLNELYEQAKKEAEEDFRKLQFDPLFIAGLSLYWGSGDRGSRSQIRFASSDMEKIQFFIAFLSKACRVEKERIRASLMVYPGQDEPSNRRFWAFALGAGVKFTKSSVVPGSYNARKLQYGICVLTVSSTYLKTKMLKWLTLLPKRLIDGR